MRNGFVPPKVSAPATVGRPSPVGPSAPASSYPRGMRRRPSRWKRTVLLGVLPLALGVGAGAVYLLIIAPGRGTAPVNVAGSDGGGTSRPVVADLSSSPPVDPAAALAAAVKLAMKEPLPREPLCERTALVEEVQRFFDAMSDGPAGRGGDPAAVVRATFDRVGFDAEVRAVGRSAEAVAAGQRSAPFGRWVEGLALQAVKETEVTRRRVRLRKVQWVSEEECVAVVRSALTPAGKSRWFLRRGADGAWRWYDWDPLTRGSRLSDVVAIALPASPSERELAWVGALAALEETTKLAARKDYAGARRALDGVREVTFPPRMEARRHEINNHLLLAGEDRVEQALDATWKALATGAASPANYVNAARCANQLRRFTTTWGASRDFRAAAGEDDNVCYEEGVAAERQGEFFKAIVMYRRGLAENPGDRWCREAIERLNATDPMLERRTFE